MPLRLPLRLRNDGARRQHVFDAQGVTEAMAFETLRQLRTSFPFSVSAGRQIILRFHFFHRPQFSSLFLRLCNDFSIVFARFSSPADAGCAVVSAVGAEAMTCYRCAFKVSCAGQKAICNFNWWSLNWIRSRDMDPAKLQSGARATARETVLPISA